MASALEEFFHFIESGRCQDATKHRQAAQKEFFEAKNRLGRHERRECESIDQIFSFIEKGHFEETNALITNAKAVFHRRIKPVVQSLQGAGKKSLEPVELDNKANTLRGHTELPTSNRENDTLILRKHATPAKDIDDQKTNPATVASSSNDQRIRASKEASGKLRKDNPNIADLSDTNRPTNIAEKFSELYDNEWTEAYIDLTQNHRLTERKTVDMLYNMVLTAYEFCRKEACHQIQQIQEAAISIVMHGHARQSVQRSEHLDLYPLIQFRKSIAASAVERLKKSFMESQKKQFGHMKHSRVLEIYVVKTVEITWWMCVQNPAVHLHTQEPGLINHNYYKPYTRSGKIVDYFIWPPLLLHENGPSLSKGIVQAK